jgi:hypothetical protein
MQANGPHDVRRLVGKKRTAGEFLTGAEAEMEDEAEAAEEGEAAGLDDEAGETSAAWIYNIKRCMDPVRRAVADGSGSAAGAGAADEGDGDIWATDAGAATEAGSNKVRFSRLYQ